MSTVESRVDFKLRAAVVEFEPEQQRVLEQIFTECPGVEVVGYFQDVETALKEIPKLEPQSVLIHIEPSIGVDTIYFSMELRRALPKLGIILISDHRIASAISFLPKSEMPGWGYLHKDTIQDPTSLRRAMRASVEGMVVLDPNMVLPTEEVPNSGFLRLTPKQLQTLQLIAEGLTNQAIAEQLNISVKTVENHINQIYQELGIDRTDRKIHPRIRAVNIYFTQHLNNPNSVA